MYFFLHITHNDDIDYKELLVKRYFSEKKIYN